MVVGFEVNFEVITPREGAGAMLALVSFVASMQLNVPIAASFVLERSITIIAGVNGALVMVVVVVAAVVELLVHQGGRGTC